MLINLIYSRNTWKAIREFPGIALGDSPLSKCNIVGI